MPSARRTSTRLHTGLRLGGSPGDGDEVPDDSAGDGNDGELCAEVDGLDDECDDAFGEDNEVCMAFDAIADERCDDEDDEDDEDEDDEDDEDEDEDEDDGDDGE